MRVNRSWQMPLPGGSRRLTWVFVGGVLFERLEEFDPKFSRFVLKARPSVLAKRVTEEEATRIVAERMASFGGAYEDHGSCA